MRLVTKISVVLATAFLFSTLLVNAAEEPVIHEISGFIIDKAGVPVDTAQIEVFDTLTGDFVTTTWVGPDGHYSMFLPAGDYVVHVPPPEIGWLQPGHQHLVVDSARIMDFMLGFLLDTEPAQTESKSTDQRSTIQSTSLPTIELVGTHEMFGRVTDQSGGPIEGTIVEIIDPATNTVWAFTTTDINGNYSVFVEAGTYNIRVIPPVGSGLGSAIALNHTIDGVTEIDFALVPQGSVLLSGVLMDPLGNPIPNQALELAPAGTQNWVYQQTGADGYYSYEVAPGEYWLRMIRYDNSESNAPRYYRIYNRNESTLSLTESTVMDIQLPVKQVTVHVQDPAGNPAGRGRDSHKRSL